MADVVCSTAACSTKPCQEHAFGQCLFLPPGHDSPHVGKARAHRLKQMMVCCTDPVHGDLTRRQKQEATAARVPFARPPRFGQRVPAGDGAGSSHSMNKRATGAAYSAGPSVSVAQVHPKRCFAAGAICLLSPGAYCRGLSGCIRCHQEGAFPCMLTCCKSSVVTECCWHLLPKQYLRKDEVTLSTTRVAAPAYPLRAGAYHAWLTLCFVRL